MPSKRKPKPKPGDQPRVAQYAASFPSCPAFYEVEGEVTPTFLAIAGQGDSAGFREAAEALENYPGLNEYRGEWEEIEGCWVWSLLPREV